MPAFGRVCLCVCECVRAVFGGCSLSSFFSFSFLFSLICVAALPNEKKDAEERSRKHNFRRFSLLLLFIYFPLFNFNVACIAEFINFAICYGMENKLEDEKVKRRDKKKRDSGALRFPLASPFHLLCLYFSRRLHFFSLLCFGTSFSSFLLFSFSYLFLHFFRRWP